MRTFNKEYNFISLKNLERIGSFVVIYRQKDSLENITARIIADSLESACKAIKKDALWISYCYPAIYEEVYGDNRGWNDFVKKIEIIEHMSMINKFVKILTNRL